jgi:hypothetical protein
VIKAFDILESSSWKVEKTTASNDTISTTVKSIGKIYKLRAKVKYPAQRLLYELFYNIEDVPTWNPTLLESKIIKVSFNTTVFYTSLMKNDFRKLTITQIFHTLCQLLAVAELLKAATL